MRIGVDIMGGDHAPDATLQGAALARSELTDQIELVLFGNKNLIREKLDIDKYDPGGFTVFHTNENILMEDHPVRIFSQKTDSGLAKGLRMLKNGELDGFTSIGNTGAMMVGCMQIINSIPGVIRPCIAASIPNDQGSPTVLLDVGLNPDCRPDVLYQYAMIGSIYSELVYDVQQPRVGLLNIGSEEEKGNLLTRSAYQAMKGTKDFNFIGNVEGNDFFRNGFVDVIVCDGFVGNVMIKEMEAVYSLLSRRNIGDDFTELLNFEKYGGTPVLGILKTVVMGHGMSNAHAFKNMILHTKEIIESNLTERIKEMFQP